jgi:DNA polymerase III epsilon subunit-like protein
VTRLLVIDTETGGTDPTTHSILSFAGVVWEDGKAADSLALMIHESPNIATDPKALEINRIDLAEVRARGVSPAAAVESINAFCKHQFGKPDQGEKVVVVGHNVAFDIAFLRRLYGLAHADYDAVFSHRSIDTASIVRFLNLAGVLPLQEAGSTAVFEHFGISPDQSSRHSAIGDARATLSLLNHLISVVRQGPPQGT